MAMPILKFFAGLQERNKEIASFALVGISSSLVYMATIAILSEKFGWGSTPSIIVAYVFGALVSYVGSGVFAFRKKMTHSNFTKFLVVVGLSFIANVVISELLSPLGVRAVVIGVVNVVLVGVFNFLCHKYWTFK